MAVVPTLEQPSVGQEPLPGRAYPRLSEEVPEGAFGATAAQGLENASEVMTHEQARQKIQNDNLRVIDADTQLASGHNALLYGQPDKDGAMRGGAYSLQGKDAINLPATLLPAYQKLADGISQTLTPDQQRIFHEHIAKGANELNLQLNRYEHAESNRLADEIYKNGINTAIQGASLGYRDPFVIGKSRADVKALMQMQGEREGWTPEQRDQETQAVLAKLHGGVIESMLADQNAKIAKAYFEEHRGELLPHEARELEKEIQVGEVQQTANGILSAYKADARAGAQQLSQVEKSDLPPEQQGQVIRAVEQGRNELAQSRRQDPAIRNQLTALDDSIAQDKVSPGALGQVESLWRRGALTDDQRTVKRDQVLRAQKKGQADQSALDFVRDAYDKGTPIDPKDSENRRKVNLFLAESTMGQPAGSPGYNNMAVGITQRLGVVPDGAVDYSRASIVGGESPAAAKGAQLLASLQRANPRAYTEAVDEKTRAMAEMISSAVSAGTEPEAAVTIARDNADLSRTQRKFLDEEWTRQRSPGQRWTTIDTNLVQHGLSDDEHYTLPGRLWGRNTSSVPAVPGPMTAEFADLSKTYFYHTGGNLQQAHQLALNDLKSTWGVSEVNGKRELMKYAPERMVPGLTADMIRADLGHEGYGAARLTESPETGASGGKVWSLTEPDKFGAWDVVRDEKGMAVRYQLPEPKAARIPFEQEFKDFDEEQQLRARQKREDFAAAHPMAVPRF